MPGVGDIDRIDEQTNHNRRRGQHNVRHKARDLSEFALFAILGKIHAGEDADWRADQRCNAHHQQATDNRVEQTASLATRRRGRVRES